jgi:hypothetical protein
MTEHMLKTVEEMRAAMSCLPHPGGSYDGRSIQLYLDANGKSSFYGYGCGRQVRGDTLEQFIEAAKELNPVQLLVKQAADWRAQADKAEAEAAKLSTLQIADRPIEKEANELPVVTAGG